MDGTHTALWSAFAAAALLLATGFDAPTPVPHAPTPPATSAPGKTVDVQMIGDATGYRFSPATVTIQRGDQVRFTLVSGPPHNVVFWADSIPKGAAAPLAKGMPKTVDKLTGPFFLKQGDTYVVSFAGAPAGRYRYYCTPHLALGMAATIVVK
ncbi:MAG TPA: plastocyanin/azurin family copper-binding protein [Gemmatimonadaceae bacterium]|nr:plastocyanin/azurin family copper-binding protein [Gemmatimonadaceae bacterium]